jgi:mannose-6-phosphate isomerase-like protein (cupin superfamily)
VSIEEEELPPNVLRIMDAKEVIQTKDYTVKDLYLPGERGDVEFTVTITNLNAGRQTRGHTHEDFVELFEFKSGEGFFLLNGRAIRVKSGLFCLVPKGMHHKVINISSSQPLIFLTYFPSGLFRKDVRRVLT